MPDRISEHELERIYDDTIVELYGFVSRRCGGRRELAEDITQETWFRALRHWREHGVPKNPAGWLMTVARNLVTSYFRRRQPDALDDVSPAEILAAVDANVVSESAEAASLVSQALLRIPQNEAKLLETFHYDRLKMSQLAALYGISERAVEGRLRRARERLRREVEIALKGNGGVV
ncbi:MAG TPA: sigma-70 family RNA polymerase sigma factor [Gemmatimonadaceae bacterium]|nr:sigma-70 family RNA polymerase sigma factor [Gemmatimonadaceae bacterium]